MAGFSNKVIRFYNFVLILDLYLSSALCFELTLLHTNDVHARIEEADVYGGTCSSEDSKAGKCYGGVARRKTVIDEIRRNQSNVLLLDGGDQFQGTLWFNVYKGKEARIFMNLLKYDAMAIGNHEFDDGVEGILPFLQRLKFSVLSANMDVSSEPKWPKRNLLYQKSKVFHVGVEKVAVIGYMSQDTTWLASPGPNIKFVDEVTSIQQEVKKLKQQNINKFIALGHSGIDVDIKIAREVPDIDVVIGGHSNTFMYTGSPPSIEKPYSSYPLLVTPNSQPSKRTLVVQDFTFGKYLGHLKLKFDQAGNVINHTGNPILLDNRFPKDPDVLSHVQNMSSHVRKYSRVALGRTHVFLDGQRSVCRLRECNLGNLITDAMVDMNRKNPDQKRWAYVSLAMWPGGVIRASINKKVNETITYGDVLLVLPFGNTADILELKGVHLLEALEHSVTQYKLSNPAGRFMQYSGFRVKYDMSQKEGKRVADVKVRCSECRVPKYEPLDKEEIYKVIVPKFIANGGDDFQVFTKHVIKRHMGSLAASLLAEYIKKNSPVTTGLEGRIEYITKNTEDRKISKNSDFDKMDVFITLAALALLAFVILIILIIMRYRTRKNSWTRKDSIDKKDVKRLSGHVNQTFENPYVSEMDSSDTNKNTIPHMSVAEANHLNSAH